MTLKKISNYFLPVALCILTFCKTFSQTRFQCLYNAGIEDRGTASCLGTDGGFFTTGYTNSYGNGYEMFILKSDSLGNLQWMKTIGGSGTDVLKMCKPTYDSGYIVVGYSSSYSSQTDGIILKLNKNGLLQWAKRINCGSYQEPTEVYQLSDSSFVVVGGGGSNSSETKIFFAKFSSSGNFLWLKRYQYHSTHGAGLIPTPDGGFAITGSYNSSYLFAKLDNNGNVSWAKVFNSGGNSISYVVNIANDGGFLMTGDTWSFTPNCKIWVIKMDNSGNIQWEKAYGIPNKDMRGFSVVNIGNTGYALVGVDYTTNPDDDGYLIRINNTGSVLWARKYFGTLDDKTRNIILTKDKGFYLTGFSNSFLSAGDYNIYCVKTDSNGNSSIGSCQQSSANISVSSPFVGASNVTLTVDVLNTVYSVNPIITNRTIGTQLFCQLPVSNFFSDKRTICKGQSVNFFDSTLKNPVSWSWKFDGAIPSSSTSRNPTAVFYNTPGKYDVKLITGNINGFDTIIKNDYIEVLPLPEAGFTISDSFGCLPGNSFKFIDTSSISIGILNSFWDFGDGNTTAISNPIHNYSTADTFPVKLLSVSGFGCKDSVSRKIIVLNKQPALFNINDSVQCFKNNSFTFTNLTNIPTKNLYSYWIFGDGKTAGSNPVTHSYKTEGIYHCRLISGYIYTCHDTTDHLVLVKVSPKAGFIINDTAQCLNSQYFILKNQSASDTFGLTYFWDLGDGFTSNSKDTSHIYLNPGIFQIKLKVVFTNSCTDSVIKKISVIPNPIKPVLSSNSPLCAGDTLVIQTDNVNGSKYEWIGPNGFHSLLNIVFKINSVLSDSGEYKSIRMKDGCYSDTSKIIIKIRSNPDSINLKTVVPSELCEGDSLILDAKSIKSTIFHWTGPAGLSIYNNKVIKYPVRLKDSGVYTLVVNIDGCTSKPNNFKINIKMKPVGIADNDGPVCEGKNVHLMANYYKGAFYEWQSSTGHFSDSQNVAIFNSILSDSGFYYLVILLNGCKSEITQTRVVVNRIPASPSVSGKFELCEGNDLKFNTSAINGGTFLWNGPAGFNSIEQSPLIENITKSRAGNYFVTVEVNNCISLPAKIKVDVQSNPVLNLGNDTTICSGNKLLLNPGSYASYFWQDSSVDATYFVKIPGIYWLKVFNSDGCFTIDSIKISELCPPGIFIPNAFSPNSDGINDSFEIKGKNIIDFKLVIFDRWGEKVFQSDDIGNSWDGKYKSVNCMEGVYFWMINYKSNWKEAKPIKFLHGTVTLLR